MSAVGIECEYFEEGSGSGMQARHFVFPTNMRSCWLDKESATIVEHSVIEQVNAIDLSNNREKVSEKRESQNPRISQALKMPAEVERENVSKIVAATVREIVGDPMDPCCEKRV